MKGLMRVMACCLGFAVTAAQAGEVSFTLHFSGLESRLSILTHSLMPGDTLDLRLSASSGSPPVSLEKGPARALGQGRWRYRAPAQPGLERLVWRAGDETMTLQLFTLRSLAEARDGVLNGFAVGHYRAEALKGLSIYAPPRGLIEVTPDLTDLSLSPNFPLAPFLSRQADGFPKYFLIRPRLLLKLEFLLARARDAGLAREPFVIMSGFRTPHYNRAIGNRTDYSRHLFGGAADIYIDEAPRDGVMDDLDGNGRIDRHDAAVLRDFIDSHVDDPAYQPNVGGLARYRANRYRGPFVHVDVRGIPNRWGE